MIQIYNKLEKNYKNKLWVALSITIILSFFVNRIEDFYQSTKLDNVRPDVSIKLSEFEEGLRLFVKSNNIKGNRIDELSIKFNIPGELKDFNYLNSQSEEKCSVYNKYRYTGRISRSVTYNRGNYSELKDLITDLELKCYNMNPGETYALIINYSSPDSEVTEINKDEKLGNYTVIRPKEMDLRDFGRYDLFWTFNNEAYVYQDCFDMLNLSFIEEDNYNVINNPMIYCLENGYCEELVIGSMLPYAKNFDTLREYELNMSVCKNK